MPERRICTFSGEEIEPGTGMMFVRRDGSILWFKNSKARKNFVKLGRNARRVKWSVEITPFAKGLYSQGKPSSDRRRIAAIKTAERYAELLGVEVASWVELWHPKRELREEFGNDWVNHWTMGDELRERTQRVISEERDN